MRRAALAVAVLATLTGCSAATPAVTATPAATAPPAANVLPDGVDVSIYQTRSDYSAGRIDIRVFNDSSGPITLESATLTTAQYAQPATWNRGTTLKPGATVDLRVDLPEPVCPTPADASPRVSVSFSTPDEGQGTAEIDADDPIETLLKLSKEDCISFAVDAHAAIIAQEEVDWEPGAREPARVSLDVTPTGAGGSATIVDVRQTILLSLVDEEGTLITAKPLDLVIDAASESSVISLDVVPNRCDPHAVAEDKRGTFFPLTVTTTEGDAGTMYVPVSDGARGSLYAFVQDYCGY